MTFRSARRCTFWWRLCIWQPSFFLTSTGMQDRHTKNWATGRKRHFCVVPELYLLSRSIEVRPCKVSWGWRWDFFSSTLRTATPATRLVQMILDLLHHPMAHPCERV